MAIRLAALFALPFASLVVAACAVGPTYVEPAPAVFSYVDDLMPALRLLMRGRPANAGQRDPIAGI